MTAYLTAYCGRPQDHPAHLFARRREAYRCPGIQPEPAQPRHTADTLTALYDERDELRILLRDAEADRDSWAREARAFEAQVEKLQNERHTYQRAWHSAKDRARKERTRAETAEAERDAARATLTAVHDVLAHWEGSDIGYSNFASQIRTALNRHQNQETT